MYALSQCHKKKTAFKNAFICKLRDCRAGPDNSCAYLAHINGGVLLIICPVAQCQAELLQAVLPTQLHFLLNTQTSDV